MASGAKVKKTLIFSLFAKVLVSFNSYSLRQKAEFAANRGARGR